MRASPSGQGHCDARQPQDYPEVQISSLGLAGDGEVRRLLRRALRDAWPAARRFGWRVENLCELEPKDGDVGYTAKDGTLFVKVRNPRKGGQFYPYSFVLATLLHELTHLSILGHGKAFYRRLAEATTECGAEPAIRREVRSHVCGELLNAVCENDARRAKALLAVLPEAARCRPPPGLGSQLPLEYAAHHGRVALTKLLLEAKADADASSVDVPPLARAAAQGNSKTMKVLLEAGAQRGRSMLPATLQALTSSVSDDAVGHQRLEKARPKRTVSLPSLQANLKERRPVIFSGCGSLCI